MSITLSPAVQHPTQSGIMLNKLAIERFQLSNGSSIDAPASVVVSLRPFADCVVNGVAGSISAPNIGMIDMIIPDLYAWIATRAGAGDMQPLNALNALRDAIGAEYVRQHPES